MFDKFEIRVITRYEVHELNVIGSDSFLSHANIQKLLDDDFNIKMMIVLSSILVSNGTL